VQPEQFHGHLNPQIHVPCGGTRSATKGTRRPRHSAARSAAFADRWPSGVGADLLGLRLLGQPRCVAALG